MDNSILTTYQRFRFFLDKAEKYTIVSMLVIIIAFIIMNVILRYIFHTGLSWSNEIAQQLFVAITYIAISRIDSQGVHFRVTILEEQFKNIGPYLETIRHTVAALLLPYLAFLASKLAYSSYISNSQLPASHLPVALCYSVVVFGLILGCLKSLDRLVVSIASLNKQAG